MSAPGAPSLSMCQDVLHLRGQCQKHQEGQGHEKLCCEKTYSQRGSLRQGHLSLWDKRSAFRGRPHLRAAPKQSLPIPL